MRHRLALPVAALITAVLTALPTTLLAAPALGAAEVSGAEVGPSVSAQAKAGKGKQCMPRPSRQSLVVRGKTTCKQVKRFLPSARELALHTQEHGYDRFTIRGFMCLLKPDSQRFACHDLNGKPQRSFVWIERSA